MRPRLIFKLGRPPTSVRTAVRYPHVTSSPSWRHRSPGQPGRLSRLLDRPGFEKWRGVHAACVSSVPVRFASPAHATREALQSTCNQHAINMPSTCYQHAIIMLSTCHPNAINHAINSVRPGGLQEPREPHAMPPAAPRLLIARALHVDCMLIAC